MKVIMRALQSTIAIQLCDSLSLVNIYHLSFIILYICIGITWQLKCAKVIIMLWRWSDIHHLEADIGGRNPDPVTK